MAFHRSNGSMGNGIGGKLDEYFDKKELPMYKDKPYNYAASKRRAPLVQRGGFIIGVVVTLLALLYWLGVFSSGPSKTSGGSTSKAPWNWVRTSETAVDWERRRQAVKEAFVLSWDGYEKYAWGQFSRT